MNRVIDLSAVKRRELRAMVNRLVLIKQSLHPMERYEVEDMDYRLMVGSPIDLASELFIIQLYKKEFKQ